MFDDQTDVLKWRVWRMYRDIRANAGDFVTRREADRCMAQLGKLSPDSRFKIEYIGQVIGHCGDKGRSL